MTNQKNVWNMSFVYIIWNREKIKCDELGKDDCGSIQQAQRSKRLVYELKRGTKLDGKENIRSKIITWLRSRDCDNIDDRVDADSVKKRSIQEKMLIYFGPKSLVLDSTIMTDGLPLLV